MNPVLVLAHNNRGLTQRCIASIQQQDITTWTYLVDNDSSDQTYEWAKTIGDVVPVQFKPQLGVSGGWNHGLKTLFECEGAEHVLVVGNDTFLPPWLYSTLLSFDLPFVTGVAVEDEKQIAIPTSDRKLSNHPDFSCFLIRKEVWEQVGPFDENLWGWTGDCDLHVRSHRVGISFHKANVPFYHVRSRTIELSPPKEKRILAMQADSDRMTFAEKWKAHVGSLQYNDLFSPDAFGIDVKNNACKAQDNTIL